MIGRQRSKGAQFGMVTSNSRCLSHKSVDLPVGTYRYLSPANALLVEGFIWEL